MDEPIEVSPAPPPDPGVADASFQEAVDCEINARHWVRVLSHVVEAYWQFRKPSEEMEETESWKHRTRPNPKVQKALDLMVIAAAERIVRIVETDLPMTARAKGKTV